MSLGITSILDAVVSHALASGHFETVNGHEPKSLPSGGLTAAVWADRITPVRTSGLASTSVLVVLNVRLYTNAQQEPADAIDPALIDAVDTLCAAYVGNYKLGGLVRQVDVRGQHGQPLDVRAGYIQQDGALLRVLTVAVPLVVNDLWSEAP